MSKSSTFETIEDRADVKAGSERSFGLVFAAVFVVIGVWPLMDGGAWRPWALGMAAAFALSAMIAPNVLGPLNMVWFKFGLALHRIVTPLVMGFIFFVAVTPTALVFRVLGKDLLDRRFKPEAKSYWHHREPPGPDPETMKNQF